jgi:hypothetical protein
MPIIVAKAVGEIRIPRGLLVLVDIFGAGRAEEPVTRGIVFERHRHGRPVGAAFPLAFGTGTGLARGAFERIIKGGADRHPAQEIAPCGLMLLNEKNLQRQGE